MGHPPLAYEADHHNIGQDVEIPIALARRLRDFFLALSGVGHIGQADPGSDSVWPFERFLVAVCDLSQLEGGFRVGGHVLVDILGTSESAP